MGDLPSGSGKSFCIYDPQLVPASPGRDLSPLSRRPRADVDDADSSGLIRSRRALQPSINSPRTTAQFPPGGREGYSIASSAQFPRLAPAACARLTHFIHSFAYICWCSRRVNTDSVGVIVRERRRVREWLISMVTHLSNAPAPRVSCIINQKTVFACIVINNRGRKESKVEMLMSRADCGFSFVCLDYRHK